MAWDVPPLMSLSSKLASLDLARLALLYQCNDVRPTDVAACCRERIAAFTDPAVWIHLVPAEEAMAQAEVIVKRRNNGEPMPLYGVPFAVKDNIDVAGHPTTAACLALSYTPRQDAPVVRRLLEAGALFVGKTNLDQFATGLAGDRSPYGGCRNVFSPEHVSGGSSSGSAVAVAAGLVSFALGTDTAGSGRVPAGCNNLVGLKPTYGLLSNDGVVPACRSLDCVTVLSLTVADARTVFDVMRGGASASGGNTGRAPSTFAVPSDNDLEFFGDTAQAALFQQSLTRLEAMGGRRLTVDLGPFREVATLLYEGPWLAERLAGVDAYLRDRAALHPVTRAIVEAGGAVTGVEVFQGMNRLRTLRTACLKVFDQAETLVVPTMPTIPTLAQVESDSIGWSHRLGHYTNFVNLLGLAALAVPAGFTPHGLPGGITLIGPGGTDERLCEMGLAWQRGLDLQLGATGARIPDAPEADNPRPPEGFVRVSVAGAHLRGQPLHPALRQTGARFVRNARSAPCYRFMAFLNLNPPRPGLLRVEKGGGSVELEIYDLPMEGFGHLVASVAPPLAIGTVELHDGETVKGFLCESAPAARARDITDFGGWLAFRAQASLEMRSSAVKPGS